MFKTENLKTYQSKRVTLSPGFWFLMSQGSRAVSPLWYTISSTWTIVHECVYYNVKPTKCVVISICCGLLSLSCFLSFCLSLSLSINKCIFFSLTLSQFISPPPPLGKCETISWKSLSLYLFRSFHTLFVFPLGTWSHATCSIKPNSIRVKFSLIVCVVLYGCFCQCIRDSSFFFDSNAFERSTKYFLMWDIFSKTSCACKREICIHSPLYTFRASTKTSNHVSFFYLSL